MLGSPGGVDVDVRQATGAATASRLWGAILRPTGPPHRGDHSRTPGHSFRECGARRGSGPISPGPHGSTSGLRNHPPSLLAGVPYGRSRSRLDCLAVPGPAGPARREQWWRRRRQIGVSRACTVCGRPTRSQARRCARHAYARVRAGWRADRVLVARHVEAYGLWCPGLAGRRAHVVGSEAELTVHHVTPLARGGAQDGPKIVACRSCNSAQGAR